jgi:hypothetical protein
LALAVHCLRDRLHNLELAQQTVLVNKPTVELPHQAAQMKDLHILELPHKAARMKDLHILELPRKAARMKDLHILELPHQAALVKKLPISGLAQQTAQMKAMMLHLAGPVVHMHHREECQ